MPRSIIVVRAVPGTVATSQPLVANPRFAISSVEAFTVGAAAIVHPPQSSHTFVPRSIRAGPAATGFATAFGYGALLLGYVAGSCGVRYPACPRVCGCHGFAPSSNTMSPKFGGAAASFLIA